MSDAALDPFWVEILDRVASAPNADSAATLVEGLATACTPPPAEDRQRSVDTLATLLGGAPFLIRLLAREPDGVAWLVDEENWRAPRTGAAMSTHLRRWLRQTDNESAWMRAIRRFRARELARIAARDLLGASPLSETTAELSLLADTCLQAAFDATHDGLRQRFGDLGDVGNGSGMAIIALGKLGALELNFSSDIDILFLYANDGETTGGSRGTTSNREWAFHAVRQVTRLLDRKTEDGRCFRVDLRLRPEGEMGPLATTPAWSAGYYEDKGQPWERIALLRARYCAGDPDVAAGFAGAIEPFVYRRTIDTELVESLRHIKRQIVNKLEAKQSPGIDVKLGRGGIREIEFFIQTLQVLHAGRNRSLRETRTLAALDRLLDASLIEAPLHAALRDDYVFLRRVEHRLQMPEDQQTHLLPRDREARAAVAWRLGLDDVDALDSRIATVRERVHHTFLSLFATDETEEEMRLRESLAARLSEQLTDVDAEMITGILAAWPVEHLRRSPSDAIADGVLLYRHVTYEEPVVARVVAFDEERYQVRLAAEDRPGLASITSGVLAADGFDIEGGRLFTIPRLRLGASEIGARAMQFLVIRPSGKAGLDAAQCDDLAQRLCDVANRWLHGETELVRAEINARWVETMQARQAVEQPLRPIDLEIDNNADPLASVVDLWAEDAPGFLYAFTQALTMRGFNVHETRIRSVGGKVFDRFHLTDRHGRKILTPAVHSEIEILALLIKGFSHFLARAADPGRALVQFDALLDRLGQSAASAQLVQLQSETLLATLATVLGSGRHLFEDFLRLAPAHMLPVLEAVSSGNEAPLPPPPADGPLRKQLQQLVAWRDAELFRLDCEHLLRKSQPFGVFAEKLTDLAEAVVSRAWDLALLESAEAFGWPLRQDGERVCWALCALGKFGGRELGYASDLELMVVYGEDGVTDGARSTSAAEFFERSVQTLRRNVPARADGIFALDLRLRPHGGHGPLAASLPSFDAYYRPDGGAAPFERQALIRLRPWDGEPEAGQRILAVRDRFTFGPEPFPVETSLALRRRQIDELTDGDNRHLKLGAGGLVELEYGVQYLQLAHGHGDASLRSSNTLEALAALEAAGHLMPDADRLRRAYIRLRAVIDALRLERGNARDLLLPDRDSHDARVLARRLSWDLDDLFDAITRHLDSVATFFRQRFGAV